MTMTCCRRCESASPDGWSGLTVVDGFDEAGAEACSETTSAAQKARMFWRGSGIAKIL